MVERASGGAEFVQLLAAYAMHREHGQELSLSAQRRIQLFLTIYSCEDITRKRLTERYKLRPATITKLVGELIDLGLVQEDNSSNSERPGRPEVYLKAVSSRLAAVVVRIMSRDVQASLLDLAGNVIAQRSVELEDDRISNSKIMDLFHDLITQLTEACQLGTEIVGVSFSLPGIVDEENLRGVYSNRWPAISNLYFDDLGVRLGLPVRLSKNLNMELRARLNRYPEHMMSSILYIHWGYGIGTSYASSGEVHNTKAGGFGELGQTIVYREGEHTAAQSLEQVASLRALQSALSKHLRAPASNEEQFGDVLRTCDISGIEALEEAIKLMALSLHNTYLILFPERIVMTGPFVQNEQLFAQLSQEFYKLLPDFVESKVELQVGQRARSDEIFGALAPLFTSAIARVNG